MREVHLVEIVSKGKNLDSTSYEYMVLPSEVSFSGDLSVAEELKT